MEKNITGKNLFQGWNGSSAAARDMILLPGTKLDYSWLLLINTLHPLHPDLFCPTPIHFHLCFSSVVVRSTYTPTAHEFHHGFHTSLCDHSYHDPHRHHTPLPFEPPINVFEAPLWAENPKSEHQK